MATDATGTPTSPDNIPTFNTSVDAPSGLGFNAAMAAIQTALSARVSKPAGIVSGEVPVWNGSAWVRSSATNIGPASLGSGTPDATKFLRGDGSWQVVATSTEMAYTEFTTNVTGTNTSEGTATTIVTSGSFTADGSSAYLIDFWAPGQTNSAAGGNNFITLFDGATVLGNSNFGTDQFGRGVPPFVHRRIVLAAGAHTITAKVHELAAGTYTILAGAGGSATALPGFIRVSKAS